MAVGSLVHACMIVGVVDDDDARWVQETRARAIKIQGKRESSTRLSVCCVCVCAWERGVKLQFVRDVYVGKHAHDRANAQVNIDAVIQLNTPCGHMCAPGSQM